jgi:hypothetical protein
MCDVLRVIWLVERDSRLSASLLLKPVDTCCTTNRCDEWCNAQAGGSGSPACSNASMRIRWNRRARACTQCWDVPVPSSAHGDRHGTGSPRPSPRRGSPRQVGWMRRGSRPSESRRYRRRCSSRPPPGVHPFARGAALHSKRRTPPKGRSRRTMPYSESGFAREFPDSSVFVHHAEDDAARCARAGAPRSAARNDRRRTRRVKKRDAGVDGRAQSR